MDVGGGRMPSLINVRVLTLGSYKCVTVHTAVGE